MPGNATGAAVLGGAPAVPGGAGRCRGMPWRAQKHMGEVGGVRGASCFVTVTVGGACADTCDSLPIQKDVSPRTCIPSPFVV